MSTIKNVNIELSQQLPAVGANVRIELDDADISVNAELLRIEDDAAKATVIAALERLSGQYVPLPDGSAEHADARVSVKWGIKSAYYTYSLVRRITLTAFGAELYNETEVASDGDYTVVEYLANNIKNVNAELRKA